MTLYAVTPENRSEISNSVLKQTKLKLNLLPASGLKNNVILMSRMKSLPCINLTSIQRYVFFLNNKITDGHTADRIHVSLMSTNDQTTLLTNYLSTNNVNIIKLF